MKLQIFLVSVFVLVLHLETFRSHESLVQYLTSSERQHQENGGGVTSAIPKGGPESVYHWYYYYNPVRPVSNWVEAWEEYFCSSLDYIMIPPYVVDHELYNFKSTNIKSYIGISDARQPFAHGVVVLDDEFEKFADVHKTDLLAEKKWDLSNRKAEQTSGKSTVFEQLINVARGVNWVTFSGNLAQLKSGEVARFVIKSEDGQKVYKKEFLQISAANIDPGYVNRVSNTEGFFKFTLDLDVFRLNSEQMPLDAFMLVIETSANVEASSGTLKVRQFKLGPPFLEKCKAANVGKVESSALSDLQIDIDEPWPDIQITDQVNRINEDLLEPGGKYKITVNGIKSMLAGVRVEVVYGDSLIARRYFVNNLPWFWGQLEFVLPHQNKGDLIIYISKYRGIGSFKIFNGTISYASDF